MIYYLTGEGKLYFSILKEYIHKDMQNFVTYEYIINYKQHHFGECKIMYYAHECIMPVNVLCP